MTVDEFKADALEQIEYFTKEGDTEAALAWIEKIKACDKNEGFSLERLNYEKDDLENAFHAEWLKENLPMSGINGGNGTLHLLMSQHDIEVSDRERKIVAHVIQWLGTNCGRCFLENALKRCGYKMIQNPHQ